MNGVSAEVPAESPVWRARNKTHLNARRREGHRHAKTTGLPPLLMHTFNPKNLLQPIRQSAAQQSLQGTFEPLDIDSQAFDKRHDRRGRVHQCVQHDGRCYRVDGPFNSFFAASVNRCPSFVCQFMLSSVNGWSIVARPHAIESSRPEAGM